MGHKRNRYHSLRTVVCFVGHNLAVDSEYVNFCRTWSSIFIVERNRNNALARGCCCAMQMSQAFLDEYGLLPPLLEITHVNQRVEVLLMSLTCILNILSEKYKINKLVEAGLIGVARPLSGHEDEGVQERVAGIFLAISSCSGLEEWLVSPLAVRSITAIVSIRS